MPDGSSSAAPVISPGPRSAKNVQPRPGTMAAAVRSPSAPFFTPFLRRAPRERPRGSRRRTPSVVGVRWMIVSCWGRDLDPAWIDGGGARCAGQRDGAACERGAWPQRGRYIRRSRRTGLGPLLPSSINRLRISGVWSPFLGYSRARWMSIRCSPSRAGVTRLNRAAYAPAEPLRGGSAARSRRALPTLQSAFVDYSARADGRARRVRSALPGPGTATVLFPGVAPGIPAYTVNVHAKFPRQQPAIRCVLCLHDTETGDLLAVMDSTYLTSVRTGLAGALAARSSCATIGRSPSRWERSAVSGSDLRRSTPSWARCLPAPTRVARPRSS